MFVYYQVRETRINCNGAHKERFGPTDGAAAAFEIQIQAAMAVSK